MFGYVAIGIAVASPIRIELNARPLSEVLRKLSSEAQTELTCQKGFENEIILLKTKGASIVEIRARLAAAMDAEWQPNANGFALLRSEGRTKQLEAEILSRRRQDVQAFFEGLKKRIVRTPTRQSRFEVFRSESTQNQGDLDAPWRDSVAGYWLAKVGVELGQDAFLAVPADREVVWSDHPNKLQKQLPPAATEMVGKFREDLEELAPEFAGTGQGAGYFRSRYKRGDLGKTLVTISRSGNSWNFWLNAYSTEGKSLFGAQMSSYNIGIDPYRQGDVLGKGADERWQALSPLAAEYEKLRDPMPEASGYGEAPIQVEPSKELRQTLLNPESFDPLAFWDAEAILALAKGRDVCARIPDVVDFAMRSCIGAGKMNVGKFKAISEKVGWFKMEETEGWLVGKALNPLGSERGRFSRAALGRFLRANEKSGRETLESVAKYHFEAGMSSVRFGFWSRYRKTFYRFGIKELAGSQSHTFGSFAMLGSLSDGQKKALARGESLRYAETSGKQRTTFDELIDTAWVEGEPGVQLSDLQQNRTEWMARVSIPEVRFFASPTNEVVSSYPPQKNLPSAFFRPWSAVEFGRGARAWTNLQEATKKNKYLMGQREVMVVRLKPDPDLVSEDRFETSLMMGKELVNYADLPEAYRKAAETEYERARKQYLAEEQIGE